MPVTGIPVPTGLVIIVVGLSVDNRHPAFRIVFTPRQQSEIKAIIMLIHPVHVLAIRKIA